jgi:peptidoglycan hydrolase FlgJ
VSTIGSTTGIGTDTSRLKSKENLDKAGQKFESTFINMMLTAARKASLGSDLFDSKALDTFREMQDGKTAELMAQHAPLGIGKAMTEFLSKSQPDLNPETPKPKE